MKKHIGSILRMESNVLTVLGLSMLLCLITAVLNHEAEAIKAFMVPVLICFILAAVGTVNYKECREKLLFRETNLLIVLTLLISAIMGAVPFLLSDTIYGTVNALFESCSAFTTTGASVVHSMASSPKSVILWRSMAGWLGGLGIVFIISMHMKIKKALIYIYLTLTCSELVLLIIAGNSFFDSLVLSLSTVSTTGFSTGSTGISAFSQFSKLILVLFMILSGVSYILYYNAVKRGPEKALRLVIKDQEFRYYAIMTLMASIGIGVINSIYANCGSISEVADRLCSAVFHVVSTISTTGFAAEPYHMWPTSSLVLLFGLSIIGGCVDSPASGIKCKRIIVEYKLIRRNLAVRLHPNRVAKLTYNKSELPTSQVIGVSNFVVTYIVILFAGLLLLSADNMGFMETFSATVSCLSNFGQGLGTLNSVGNFALLNSFSKVVCMVLMIIGRLEIFPFITLFSKYYWSPNSVR